MAREMTEQEIATHLETATEAGSCEHGDLGGDDYFTAILYKSENREHFRYIDSAGMTTDPGQGFAQWLDDAEVAAWKDF